MNSAVVNVKVEPEIKEQAQKVAEELGFSLSAVIKAYLKELIRTKTVSFTAREEPTDYLLNALKESEKDIKAGRVSPTFDNAEDAINWLNDSERRYENQIQRKIR